MNKLKSIYLDWVNNYVTPSKFAQAYGLTTGQGVELIKLLRKIYDEPKAITINDFFEGGK